MGHPDQYTPDDHNITNRDSAPGDNLSEEAEATLDDAALEKDAQTGTDVRTPEPEIERQGEAGNTYTGRQMSDRLKHNERIEDADKVEKGKD